MTSVPYPSISTTPLHNVNVNQRPCRCCFIYTDAIQLYMYVCLSEYMCLCCTTLHYWQVFRANALCTFVSAAARVCISNTNNSSSGVSLCNTLGRFAPIIVGTVAACGGLFLPLNKVIKHKFYLINITCYRQ
jgi:hypothetical protein